MSEDTVATVSAQIEPFDVACPLCGSPPGWLCLRVRGGARAASHKARWDLSRKLKRSKKGKKK